MDRYILVIDTEEEKLETIKKDLESLGITVHKTLKTLNILIVSAENEKLFHDQKYIKDYEIIHNKFVVGEEE